MYSLPRRLQPNLQHTVSQIVDGLPETLKTPILTPLTAEDALMVFDPKGIGGAVNVIVHEHKLGALYNALTFVNVSDRIPDSDKGAWSTVVLQITGKRNV